MTPLLTVRIFVKGQLINPANASRWSRYRRAEWAQRWRHATKIAWLQADQPRAWGPATVRFHGYVARLFDDDSFPLCCKPVRDEVVRLVLGTDDGPTAGHTYEYRQEVRPKAERGVLITIAAPRPICGEGSAG